MSFKLKLATLFAAVVLVVTPAMAQDNVERVERERFWSIFENGSGGSKVCWIASAPTSSTATRHGAAIAVNRGDIRLMVRQQPGSSVVNEVSFTGGYPFRSGSNVTLNIGSDQFQFTTDGEWAWSASPADDQRIVQAMRRGATARVVGVSSRGNQTTDTISLIGFTAALESSTRRCQG